MSIKYYNLAKDEELPEEFCAVRNVNGEPSEYTWYERMSDFERELWVLFNQSDWFAGSEYRKLQAENAKLREERDYYKALWEHATVTDCELRRVRAAWKEDREKNDKLRESLERATGIIADICGECPVSRYEWLSSDGCAEKCGTVTEEECWIAYLTGKRWDESGVEVDG